MIIHSVQSEISFCPAVKPCVSPVLIICEVGRGFVYVKYEPRVSLIRIVKADLYKKNKAANQKVHFPGNSQVQSSTFVS